MSYQCVGEIGLTGLEGIEGDRVFEELFSCVVEADDMIDCLDHHVLNQHALLLHGVVWNHRGRPSALRVKPEVGADVLRAMSVKAAQE